MLLHACTQDLVLPVPKCTLFATYNEYCNNNTDFSPEQYDRFVLSSYRWYGRNIKWEPHELEARRKSYIRTTGV
eukprot:1032627-Rhodomonas_salina.1